jgi:anthranilate synthase component 1
LEYIRAGDIFQVVLSQRLQTTISASAFEIYRTLRVVNPSPFMFYLRMPQATLVGSSPEIMVRVVAGKVTVRPLAGTRRRGATEEEDRRLGEELLADPKERAEHVMLVDLGRNDVGRVARYGSVEVSDVMTIERYSHVMHITSNVTGQLAEGRTAFDALRACLPAGTVSGAPKVRAMQIIDEMEPHRRGPYAGAVGHVDFNGNMDTCIALRTIVVQGNKAYIQAGAGIVADSVPASEYQETLNKARGLLKAIELTERRVLQAKPASCAGAPTRSAKPTNRA